MVDVETILPIMMFAVLFGTILTGFPVAFTLAGTGLIFAVIGNYFEIFIWTDFGFVPSKIFGLIQNFTLLAVPLFIFMGMVLDKSGIAEELLSCAELLCRKVKGGLLVSLIVVGALLAASTGIVGATVVTMGVISLPAMMERKYNKELACGTIAAAGTLGQIIPPSIVLVVLGDMMNVAVADLFAGAIIPGSMLVTLYIAYVLFRAYRNPELTPLPESSESFTKFELAKKVLHSIVPPLLLMLCVLGSILGGIASPTESAACGALMAMILALVRGKLTYQNLKSVVEETCSMTTMVFTLLIGAQIFSVVFRGLYGDELIADFLNGLDFAPGWTLLIVMLMMFFLGFFLDFIEICFIVVPLVAPVLINDLGFNGIWIAILFAINLQTSFLTPPFGFALFYLKGVAPEGVKTSHIYRGIIPFVGIQLIVIGLLAAFPTLATWLPNKLFGS